MSAKTALIVLGMHRSGTSSVAGALALAGASAPRRLMPPAADNPKGFWESSAVAAFNDRLLKTDGSDWRDWRLFNHQPLLDDPHARAEAVRLLAEEFDGAEVLVLKDPRICRLFPFWRRALSDAGYEIVVISPVRPPSEVAASLVSRNGMSRDHALRLWLRHVLEAERHSRDLPRRFLLWPDFLDGWREDLAAVSRLSSAPLDLGTEALQKIEDFLTSDLRRQTEASPTPALVHRAYGLLSQLARHGDHPDLHADLDQTRRMFDDACDLFSDAPR